MIWINTTKALEKTGIFMVQRYREKLSQSDPYTSNATYTLFSNVNYEVLIDPESLGLAFNAPDSETDPITGKVWIEQGRKHPSRRPPIWVIEKWMLDRGIVPYQKTLRQSAFLISRSIGLLGIKPKPYLNEIREEILVGTQLQDIKNAVISDINNVLKIR